MCAQSATKVFSTLLLTLQLICIFTSIIFSFNSSLFNHIPYTKHIISIHVVVLLPSLLFCCSPLSQTVFIFPKLSSQWHSFFNDSFNKNHNNNNNRGNQQWRQQPSASFVTSSCCRTWREVLAGIVNSFGFLWNVCPSLGLGVRQARLGAERLGCCIWWGGRGSGGAV